MDKQFVMLEATRKNILSVLEMCTVKQLFMIPAPFNNHIFWNAAHILATQQMLWYGFTGTPYRLDKSFIDRFAKGTTPSDEVDPETVKFVKSNLLATVVQAREDYHNQVFGPYEHVTTSYGITLNTLEEAIHYNNLHESMHFGQIKMLARLLD